MKILNTQDGLTLIETIIALVLMLVLMAAFAGAMVVALQSEVEVDKRLEASSLASSIIEYLKEENNLANVITGGNYPVTLYINDSTYELYSLDGETTITYGLNSLEAELFFNDIKLGNNQSNIYIEKYDPDAYPDLYKVRVDIKWTDRNNDWDLELVTLMAVDQNE